MYPIKFENLYYEKVWGGREFEKFRTNPKTSVFRSSDLVRLPRPQSSLL